VVGPLKDGLLVAQLKAVGLTIVWSVVATAIIAYIVKAIIGLRPAPRSSAGPRYRRTRRGRLRL
jgi:Amt family ammonium transporter